MTWNEFLIEFLERPILSLVQSSHLTGRHGPSWKQATPTTVTQRAAVRHTDGISTLNLLTSAQREESRPLLLTFSLHSDAPADILSMPVFHTCDSPLLKPWSHPDNVCVCVSSCVIVLGSRGVADLCPEVIFVTKWETNIWMHVEASPLWCFQRF